MNAFNEGMYKPLPKCASGTLDPTALSRSCIASTKREGDIAHPIAIPTSRGTHFVVSWWRTSSWTRLNNLNYATRHMMGLQRLPCELVCDPYAFAKSIHTTYKLSRRFLALWIASQIMEECSMQPGTPGTPPFWIDVRTCWTTHIQWASTQWRKKNTFPSTFSNEMGLNWLRLASPFPSVNKRLQLLSIHRLPCLTAMLSRWGSAANTALSGISYTKGTELHWVLAPNDS